jgi:hypothetical protein
MLSKLGSAIYGTITVGALLAAESARSETYLATVIAVLITLLVYWLAHTYAELASARLRDSEALTFGGFVRTLANEAPILVGAAVPLVVLLVEWAFGAHLTTAVDAAIWTAALTVVLIEIVSAIRAEQTGRALVVQILFGALLGLLVVLLRLVLH